MSQPAYGRIVNYRIGIRTQMSHECLVQFTGVDSPAQAGQLIGKKVLWKGKNKGLSGKIVGIHGRNGVLRVRFKTGLPGQALGSIVPLIG